MSNFELTSLSAIFKDSLFRIPDYQRGFAWTIKELSDFWDDLYNLSDSRSHYTGVLTVKSISPETIKLENWNEERWLVNDKGYNAYYVVDGQQRLTTSVIFIQSLIEVIKTENKRKKIANTKEDEIILGSYTLKEIRENFIFISNPSKIIKSYKFGYETDNPSFTFLRHKIFMEENSGKINETFYTLNLENAKIYFKEKLSGVYKLEGFRGLEQLNKKLINNFKYNLYKLDEDFDVFVAFETMNNRGKKLSNLELLKNRLIYLTTLYENNEIKEDERKELRGNIDDAWKEIYHQLGRNKKHPLNDDEFLLAHWIIYFKYSREKGNDYVKYLLEEKFTPKKIFNKKEIPVHSVKPFQEIRDIKVEEENEETEDSDKKIKNHSKLKPILIKSYVKSLKSTAAHWYNTFNPIKNNDLTPEESKWIFKLNRIGIGYFRPLVTSSFLNKNIESTDRVNLLKTIERFIFIAFRLGRSFSSYRNSEFYNAARQLRKNEISILEITELLNERMKWSFKVDEEKGLLFDHVHFLKYIQKKFLAEKGYFGWNGLKYFLYEYELELKEKQGNEKIDWDLFIKNENDKISIEHVLPQTPTNSCWENDFKKFKKQEIARLQGTLGNLVPLSMSINSSLQNDCFWDKKRDKFDKKGKLIRRGYNDGSHSEIEISKNKEWTEDEILHRGMNLLLFMERNWKIKFESKLAKIEFLGLPFLN